jgi:hypothetical protein
MLTLVFLELLKEFVSLAGFIGQAGPDVLYELAKGRLASLGALFEFLEKNAERVIGPTHILGDRGHVVKDMRKVLDDDAVHVQDNQFQWSAEQTQPQPFLQKISMYQSEYINIFCGERQGITLTIPLFCYIMCKSQKGRDTVPQITLMMDGKIPIRVDEEDFEVIKLMVTQAGAVDDTNRACDVIRELMKQGYVRSHAVEVVTMARSELRRL